MRLTRFYQQKGRLSYNPRKTLSSKRVGLRRFISFDDRFVAVARKLEELILQLSSEKVKVLDVGVGDAVYESIISASTLRKSEIYGIDISKAQLKRAEKYLKEAKVVDLNENKIPYQSGFFDIVIASEILEHVFYPDDLLKETVRVLKPGGKLIITIPNSGSIQLRLSVLFTGSSPLLNYPGNREHIRFFNKGDITKMLNGSRLIGFQGLSSFLFGKWNFPAKVVTPRFLQTFGNRFLPGFALGNLLVFQK